MKKIFYGILLALIISCAPIFAQDDFSSSLSYVPNEVIVTYKSSPSTLQKGLRTLSLPNEEASIDEHTSVVKITDGQTVAQAIQDFQNDPNVESVQPNFVYHLWGISNDPYF